MTFCTAKSCSLRTGALESKLPLFAVVVLTGIAGLLPVLAGAQAPDTQRSRLERVDAYVAARLERGRVPGAALVIVHGDSVVYSKCYGVADPTGRLVTADTPFILGSTTKSITATAVMLLAETGVVDLDAPAREYIPWFRTADPERSAGITVRFLLNHTSGLSGLSGRKPLADRDTSAAALDRFVRSLSAERLVREPGSAFEYSNANYSILGSIVQAVTGRTYQSFIDDRIFVPLGMTHSHTSQTAAERDGLATGYRYWFGFPRPAADMPFVRAVAPAGYLISTAHDLARYLMFHLNAGVVDGTQLLSEEAVLELHNPSARVDHETEYSMGWLVQTEGEQITVWHNGGIPNFYSFLGMLPESRDGVVLLANGLDVLAAGQFDAIALGAIDLLRGREPRVAPSSSFHPPLNVAVFWVLVILTWQLVWVAASILKRRPWQILEKHTPVSAVTELRKIGLPIVLNCGWALCVLSVLPGASGTPFAVMRLYAPDFGFLATVSVIVALAWGTVQVALRVRALVGASRR